MAKSPSVKALIDLADSTFDGSDTSKSAGKASDSKSDCYSYVEAVKANASVVSLPCVHTLYFSRYTQYFSKVG